MRPDVSQLLNSTSPEDRRQAVLLLVRERVPDAVPILERLSEEDPAPQIRYIARRALTAMQEGHESILGAPGSGRTVAPKVPEAMRLIASADAAERAKGVALAIRSGDALAAQPLQEMLSRETDEALRAGALGYFARHGRPVHLAALIPLVRDRSAALRARLVPALAKAGGDKAWPYVVYLLQDGDAAVRKSARELLGAQPREAMLGLLTDMVGAGELWMRDSAANALGHLEVADVVPPLARACADAAKPVREKAEKGLARLAERGVPGAADALAKARAAATPPPPPAAKEEARAAPGGLDDPNPRVRIHALAEAIHRKDPDLTDAIVARLDVEENDYVVSKCLIALGHLGDGTAPKAVETYLTHPDTRIAASAIEAMDLLGNRAAAAKIRPLLAHRAPRIRANALHYFRDDANVDVDASLKKMLTAREFPTKLAGLWLLERLPRETYGNHVQLVLGDINDDVRERAFHLLDGWAKQGSEDAQAMLDMCRAGDVAIKHESLRLARAPAPHRLLAFMLDLMVIGTGTAFLAGSLAPASGTLSAIVLAIGTGLFFVRDAFNDGRGMGKKALGLRCVDLASNRGCTRAQSLIRQGFIGLGLAGVVELVMLHVDESGRRMGDWLMNTQVILEKDEPLSAGGKLVAAGVYGWLALSALGAVIGLFTPAERSYRAEHVSVQLPRGWEFSSKSARSVNALRRSLLRGEEMRLEIEMRPSLSIVKSGGHAPIVVEGQEFRDVSLKTFKAALEGFDLKSARESAERTIAGQRAFEFDILFSKGTVRGIVRGICFTSGTMGYYVTVLSRDESVFRKRESELDELLGGLKVN